MATIKTSDTGNLAQLVIDKFLGIPQPSEGAPVFSDGIGEDFTQNAFSAKNLIQNVQGDPSIVTSSTATKLVVAFADTEEYEEGDSYTYKETITLSGVGLPVNLDGLPSADPFITTINDVGSEKYVDADGVTRNSSTYTNIFSNYINPTVLDDGIYVTAATEKESGFFTLENPETNGLVKVTFASTNTFTGDVFIDISGEDASTNQASGLITKFSTSDTQTATGFSFSDKFSFISADGFGFDTNNTFSGSLTNLNFAKVIKQGTFTSTDTYAATGNNDLLADVLTAYAAGEASIDDISAALLFGNDVIAGIDSIEGGDRLLGFDGNDNISGLKGNDLLDGGNGNDTLNGGDGSDLLFGEANNDSILGGNGDDFINGGAGKDTLKGDAGNDFITGGVGADILTGGLGNDTFEFNTLTELNASDSGISTLTMDRVLDFKTGFDNILIDLGREVSGLAVEKSLSTAVNYGQALSKANFYFKDHLESDTTYFVADKLNGYLFADADNNGVADLAITLVGINLAAEFLPSDVEFASNL